MESSEEESRENHPSLPPNYVSLAQLRERWLQRQKQEQEIKERREKQEQKQPKQEGKLIIASRGQQQEKGKKKFCERERGRERNGWRRVEGRQKVYRPKGALDGNRPEVGVGERELKSEEFKVGALADHEFHGGDGKEEKIVSGRKEKKNRNKRVARVKGGLIGEQESRGNLGDLSGRNGGEEGCREEFGRNGNGDKAVEGKVTVCVAGVVPENKGKEVTLVGMGGKCGGDKVFGEQDWRYGDDWSLGGSSSVCTMEVLPENETGKEDPVAENGDYQGRLEAGSFYSVEVLPENKVEEDCSVIVGRKRGEGRVRARYQSNADNTRNWRVSTDSKIEAGRVKNVVEKGDFLKENERSGNHRARTARGIQADGYKVSGNLSPKIRRDLRFLSLDESRVGNGALRRGRHVWQQRRYEKSRDFNGLVWRKKEQISDTNVAEI